MVDIEYNEHVPGQKRLHDGHAPLLKRLRQHGVVGVVEHSSGDAPRLVPRKVILVQQDAHELDYSERWVRIVQLHGHKVRKLLKRVAAGLVAAEDVLDGGRYKEVPAASGVGGRTAIKRNGNWGTHCCLRRSSLPL